MVRPAAFGYNSETAMNNFFQSKESGDGMLVHQQALSEFDGMVRRLRDSGIEVIVFDDTPEPRKPDAIFPNNWFASFPDGVITVFPMFAHNRRIEKRDDILNVISQKFEVNDVQDWSEFEAEAWYLEGTGSMVIDHDNRIIFACLSERTHPAVLAKFASLRGFSAFAFHAVDARTRPVYHTNVMMCLGEGFAVVCEEAVHDDTEKQALRKLIISTGRQPILINLSQMHAFAGNMLQVKNKKGEKFLVLSQAAYESLDPGQLKALKKYSGLLPVAVPTIERIEGGSARCMIAEIFLKPL